MKSLIVLFIISLFSILATAQDNVGIGTVSPSANAILHLDNGAADLGLLLPNVDLTAGFTPAGSDAGLMVFNTDDNKIYIWNGSGWVSSTSEWGVNGTNIYNLNSGNVGIGTNSPQTKLSIATSSNLAFQIDGSSNTGTWLSINNSGTGGEWFHIVSTASGNGDAGDLAFYKGSDAGTANGFFMALDHATSYVGIGNSSPTAKLSVFDNVFGAVMDVNSAGGNTLIDFNNTGSNPANWTFGYLGNTGVNPGFMTFLSGSHRFVVTNNGDVGIAETNPQARLEINSSGNSSATNALLINNATPTNIFAVRDDGNIGIGTQSPFYKTDIVNGTAGIENLNLLLRAPSTTTGTGSGIRLANTTNANGGFGYVDLFSIRNGSGQGELAIRPNGTEIMRMSNSLIIANNMIRVEGSNGGINLINRTGGFPYYNFVSAGAYHVAYNGNSTANSSLKISGYNTTLGEGFVGGGPRLSVGNSGDGSYAQANSWLVFSDRSLKENITPLTDAENLLSQLQAVRYTFKSSGKADIGFIAQDVKKVLPELVEFDEERQLHSMDYARLTPVLVEVLKNQEKRIKDLELEIEQLRMEVQNR